MSKCATAKKMYPTESVAEDALITAWTTYDYKKDQGPVGVYLCDICGAYHLTSKGSMNSRLSQLIALGKVKREAEANRWLDRLKNKR